MSSENLQTTYMMLIRRRNNISRCLNPQLEKFVIIAQRTTTMLITTIMIMIMIMTTTITIVIVTLTMIATKMVMIVNHKTISVIMTKVCESESVDCIDDRGFDEDDYDG